MNAVPLKHNLINVIIDKFFSGSVTCLFNGIEEQDEEFNSTLFDIYIQ